MFKSTVFRIEMEFWRQRLSRYPVFAFGLILLAVLGILSCSLFASQGTYDQYGVYGGAVAGNDSLLQESLIRWHFYAASDREEDQVLKIAVKEAVMAEAEELFAKAENMTDCRRILAANLPLLYETACRALAEEEALGFYGTADIRTAELKEIQVYYGPRYFSPRQLAEGQLSAGVYETVTFILGEGQGENWWCLLYPPLAPGQKVVFTPVPQSRITQRAQQKYDGKHDLNSEVNQERNLGQDQAAEGQYSEERLPVQLKLKIWEVLRKEN